jgi:hypothetical protein
MTGPVHPGGAIGSNVQALDAQEDAIRRWREPKAEGLDLSDGGTLDTVDERIQRGPHGTLDAASGLATFGRRGRRSRPALAG